MIPTRLKLAVAEVVLGAATLCGLPPVIASPMKAATQTMVICWYGREFHGKMMANGQPFDEDKLTAAHKTIPLGTKLLLQTRRGKSVVVEVTDRGPWVKGRDLDISLAAASRLGIVAQGIAVVSYKVVKE